MLMAGAAAFLFLTACSKSDDGPVTPSVESISGSYKVGSVTIINGTARQDVLSEYFDTCEKDDILQLKNDKSYANVDAGVVCNPSNAYTGTWDVLGGKIIIDGDDYTIKSYNGKQLILSEPFTFGAVTVELETVWNKQ